MQEHFLNYQQSFEVMELGFDEPTFASYIDKKLTTTLDCVLWGDIDTDIPAPLKSQFFKWARDVHGIDHLIERHHDNSDSNQKDYSIIARDDKNKIGKYRLYDTYEEAENSLIDTIIELIKNKNNVKAD